MGITVRTDKTNQTLEGKRVCVWAGSGTAEEGQEVVMIREKFALGSFFHSCAHDSPQKPASANLPLQGVIGGLCLKQQEKENEAR